MMRKRNQWIYCFCVAHRGRESLHCSCKGALCATPFCGPCEGADPLGDDSNQKSVLPDNKSHQIWAQTLSFKAAEFGPFLLHTIFYGKRCNFLRPPLFLLFTSLNAIYHVTCQGHTGEPGCGGKGNILGFTHVQTRTFSYTYNAILLKQWHKHIHYYVRKFLHNRF
jgi:hypothetical protein